MRLENEGLTQREGRGWKVTPIDLAEVRAIMEYREAVEVAAVRLAVERADDEELRGAAGAVRGAPRLRRRGDRAARLSATSTGAGAPVAQPVLPADGMAGALTRLSRTRWLGVRTQQSRSDARDEHLEIVAAIRDRDTDRAVALTVAHNRDTRDRLLAYLGEERRAAARAGLLHYRVGRLPRRRCGRLTWPDHGGRAR